MFSSAVSYIAKVADQEVPGIFLALTIIAVVFLYKALMNEKDKELSAKELVEEKVTLVLQEIDNTEKAILVYLERDNEKDKKKR